jgi:hypothetical protein
MPGVGPGSARLGEELFLFRRGASWTTPATDLGPSTVRFD